MCMQFFHYQATSLLRMVRSINTMAGEASYILFLECNPDYLSEVLLKCKQVDMHAERYYWFADDKRKDTKGQQEYSIC